MKRSSLSILLSVFTVALFAQGEANNWVFGEHAGISFNTGVPVAFSGSAMVTQEGCASISNKNGNLLFYTDGATVWNRNHQSMPNGTGLLGNFSTTQTAMVLPMPGDTSKYIVFTVSEQNVSNGVRYSVVDITLQSGLGDVVVASKNTLLYSPTTEKITATKHTNGTDIWVISHAWGTDSFFTYQVTSAGVNPVPVISSVGMIHSGFTGHKVGYMKASPNGQKLAVAVDYLDGGLELLNFDNSTGQVINSFFSEIATAGGATGPYGVEFSPNSRYVYTGNAPNAGPVWQYDSEAGSAAAILASKYMVAPNGSHAAVQLAPNGKLYVAKFQQNFISAINYPNLPGAACGYQDTAVFLTGGTFSRYGFPSFVSSFFYQNGFSLQHTCVGDTTTFAIEQQVDSARWNFGDTASGVANGSIAISPSHVFSSNGTYTVTLISWKNNLPDTAQHNVVVLPLPVVNLGSDTVLCTGQSFQLNAATANGNYLWQNNSTAAVQNITQNGMYWVAVTVAGCTAADTINVNFSSIAPINLGADTVFCPPHTLTLNATTPGATYLWQDNATSPVYAVSQTGTYSVTVTTAGGCVTKDTIHVNIYQIPSITTTASQMVFCSNDSAQICAPAGFPAYLWNNGATGNCITAKAAGYYYVTVTDQNGCTVESNHLPITVHPSPPVSISVNGDTLSVYNEVAYQWYLNGNLINGATDSIYLAKQAGTYSVAVTDTKGCTAFSNGIVITGITTAAAANFALFPNPANDQLNITVDETLLGAQLNIYTTTGALVYTQQLEMLSLKLEIARLASAVYIAEIKTEEGTLKRRWVKM